MENTALQIKKKLHLLVFGLSLLPISCTAPARSMSTGSATAPASQSAQPKPSEGREDAQAVATLQPFPEDPPYNPNLALGGSMVPLEKLEWQQLGFSRTPAAGLYHVRSAEEWPGENPAPKVDYNTYDVILVVEGIGSSQRGIDITFASQQDDDVLVDVELQGPGEGCEMTRQSAPILDAAIMPKTKQTVQFQVRSARRSCKIQFKR